MISFEFLLTSLLVVLIPDTGVIYTVSTGLLRGRRASLFASFGCTLGILPHLAATIVPRSKVGKVLKEDLRAKRAKRVSNALG